jgi:hypothetical protein
MEAQLNRLSPARRKTGDRGERLPALARVTLPLNARYWEYRPKVEFISLFLSLPKLLFRFDILYDFFVFFMLGFIYLSYTCKKLWNCKLYYILLRNCKFRRAGAGFLMFL